MQSTFDRAKDNFLASMESAGMSQDEIAMATQSLEKRLDFFVRLREGRLEAGEFLTLPGLEKVRYAFYFGVPKALTRKTPEQLRLLTKFRTKRNRRNALASASRRRNRA